MFIVTEYAALKQPLKNFNIDNFFGQLSLFAWYVLCLTSHQQIRSYGDETTA